MAGTVRPDKNGGKVTPEVVTAAALDQNDRDYINPGKAWCSWQVALGRDGGVRATAE
jgi:hypothetical protein